MKFSKKVFVSLGLGVFCLSVPLSANAASTKGSITVSGTGNGTTTAYYNNSTSSQAAMSADIVLKEGTLTSTANYSFYLAGANCSAIGSMNYYKGWKWHTNKNGIPTKQASVADSSFTITGKTFYSVHKTVTIYDGPKGTPYAYAEIGW